MSRLTAIIVAAYFFLIACDQRPASIDATPVPAATFRCDEAVPANPGWSCLQRVGKYAVRCSGYHQPGTAMTAQATPLIYQVSDLGKRGVPRLDVAELRQINAAKS